MGRVVFLQRIMYEFGAPPLLAALLQQHGYDVSIRIGKSVYDFAPHIANGDIVAFSVMSDEEQWALSVARGLKEIFAVTIVMGGPHPTFFPEVLRDPAIDFICRGEGESAMIRLAEHIHKRIGDVESIDNIGYKRDGAPVLNELAHLVEDLGSLPYPQRALYYDRYSRLRENDLKPFTAGRGCPYGCTFCFNEQYRNMYQGKGQYVRYRPVDHLIGEIDHIRSTYGLKTVLFTDDIFILNRDWLRDFCREYGKAIKLPYVCCVRANLLDEEIVSLLSESGCFSVYFGIESGNEDLRVRLLKKKISDDQIIGAAELLRKHSIKFMTFNIIGSPGETIENVYETIEINRRIRPDFPRCSLMAYFPGTPITQYAEERGYLPSGFQLTPFAQQGLSRSVVHSAEMQNLHSFFQTAVLFPSSYPLIKKLAKLPPNIVFKAWWALVYFWVFCRGENRNVVQTLRFGAGYVADLLRGVRDDSATSNFFVCPSCGNSTVRTVLDNGTTRVVRCRKCHLEALHPPPADFPYDKDYYESWGGEERESETSLLKQKTSEFLLEYLDLPAGSKILEVGCAKGDFVAAASHKGYAVTGIDINAYAIERAKQRNLPAEFHVSTLQDATHSDRTFDAVIMVDVIEHIDNPNRLLRNANRLLRRDGKLLVVTPNIDGFYRKTMRATWPHYKKEHLFYFGRRHLINLLRRSGFEHEKSMPMRKFLSFRYIHDQLRIFDSTALSRIIRRLIDPLTGTGLYRKAFSFWDGSIVLVGMKVAEP